MVMHISADGACRRLSWPGVVLACALCSLLAVSEILAVEPPPRPILAGDVIVAFKPDTEGHRQLLRAEQLGTDPSEALTPVLAELGAKTGVPLELKQRLSGNRLLLAVDCAALFRQVASRLRSLPAVKEVDAPSPPSHQCFRAGAQQVVTVTFREGSNEHQALARHPTDIAPEVRAALDGAIEFPHELRRHDQERVGTTIDGIALTLQTITRLATVPDLDAAQPNYLMKLR